MLALWRFLCSFPPLALVPALSLLGMLAREPWLPGPGGLLLYFGPMLMLPPILVGLWLGLLRDSSIRTGAALGAGLAAAWANWAVLDPAMNQDANIAVILYVFGGFVPLLLPAALLGAGVGRLLGGRRAPV